MEWTDVGAEGDLAPGEVKTIAHPRGDVVVWRTVSGQIRSCDARCPHQLAHLGELGVVDGEDLVCRSHFWRFDDSGVGVKVSASGRRDVKSPLDLYRIRERNGRIEIVVGENTGK